MLILEYIGLNYSRVKRQYEKIISFLERDDFRSAQVKKLPEYGLYTARLDDSNRLIFKSMKYNGKYYAVILEVVLNHAYNKSKFLRGAKIDESKLPVIDEISKMEDENLSNIVYVNPTSKHVHILDKIISFDSEQDEVYRTPPPIIIIGPAGSGKTALTLEKMKLFHGQGLYVTLSPYLVENARNIYFANNYENENQELSFLSFKEFLETIHVPQGKEITYRTFASWIMRFPKQQRVSDPHKLYEEFKGVITGSEVNKPYLSREEYLALGVKQSIFLESEREKVYALFEKYLNFLRENGFYDPNITAFNYLSRVSPTYDFVVIDEVQDITNVQLYLILKTLTNPANFILCGDSNQIVHPNFFSWSKLKSMFYNNEELRDRKIIRILHSNFRNSLTITELSNKLIKIKQKRFGSIDRESTYLMKSLSSDSGEVLLIRDNDKVKSEINKMIRRSVKYALIVMRDEDKAAARKYFDTPLIFSIHEAKGLEYDNVVLYNFVSNETQNFMEIIKGISEDDLQDELRYMRASDKRDKSLEIYKFFINSLYVAVTRAIKKLYLIESYPEHSLLRLVGLKNAVDKVSFEAPQSTLEEWQAEARKLELQGKTEQAEEIRRSILKTEPVPWDVLTPEKAVALANQIRIAKDNPQKPRKTLFDYALFYDATKIIEFLSLQNFDKARQIYIQKHGQYIFNWSLYEQHRTNFLIKILQKYSTNFYTEIIKNCEKYGVDHKTEFNATPLMLAIKAGNIKLIKDLLKYGADTEITDIFGMNAWQLALQRTIQDKKYAENVFSEIHKILSPSGISLKVDEKLIKIDSKLGEFLIFHILYVLIPRRFNESQEAAITAVELSKLIENLPETVVPEYRKKRQYISSLLSKNEVQSTNPYTRKIFKRIQKGKYVLNPEIQIKIKDIWIEIYKSAGIELLSHIVYGDDALYKDFLNKLK
ncbi:AAA family ATPase [Thermodesulfovibrio hydrogeniphilus]